MKSIFIVNSVFLIGFLVWVGFMNHPDVKLLFFLMLCVYTIPLIIGILYITNGIFRNLFVKWSLLISYFIAATAITYLMLLEGTDVLGIVIIAMLTINAFYILKSKVGSIDFDKAYKMVAEEKLNNFRDDGLWMQAISLSGGDEKKIEGVYIKLRAQKIIKSEIDNLLSPKSILLE